MSQLKQIKYLTQRPSVEEVLIGFRILDDLEYKESLFVLNEAQHELKSAADAFSSSFYTEAGQYYLMYLFIDLKREQGKEPLVAAFRPIVEKYLFDEDCGIIDVMNLPDDLSSATEIFYSMFIKKSGQYLSECDPDAEYLLPASALETAIERVGNPVADWEKEAERKISGDYDEPSYRKTFTEDHEVEENLDKLYYKYDEQYNEEDEEGGGDDYEE